MIREGKVKIAAVSYLNTKPFLEGLEDSDISREIEMTLAFPARCADLILSGKVDMGLVPVAVLLQIPGLKIIADYCIGSIGEVKTVCLLGDCPVQEMDTIYLDYQSRTSVLLLQVLLKNHWGVTPVLKAAQPGYEKKIKGTTGGLVIGDRAIELAHNYTYCYDMGASWEEYAKLPFTYAVWVSVKPMQQFFLNRFNEALAKGLKLIHRLVQRESDPGLREFLDGYYGKYISYDFDERKKAGLDRFLSDVRAMEANGSVQK